MHSRCERSRPGRQVLLLPLGRLAPSAQLFQATDPVSFLSGMITPVVKAPAEWITNYSMFFKDRIERYPGETSEFLGRRLGKKQINLLRNLRLVNNIDKSSSTRTRLAARRS